jgi:Flp pilus assembly protein TadG
MSRFLDLLREKRGTAIIEMAFVAPVIALMTVGVVDLSNGFSAKLRLEQAAQRSIEKVMQTTGVQSVEDTIISEAICQVNGTVANSAVCKTAPITAANVTVTHTLYCGTSNVPSPGTDCAAGVVESRWISVNIWDEYEPLFPIHFTGTDANGKYRIEATAGMRTE